MTDTTVTPEMLLFLAGKMGLWSPRISMGEVIHAHDDAIPCGPKTFTPHTNPAQWQQVVVWAAMNDIEVTFTRYAIVLYTRSPNQVVRRFHVDHDNTPQSIIGATLKAVALATGWGE